MPRFFFIFIFMQTPNANQPTFFNQLVCHHQSRRIRSLETHMWCWLQVLFLPVLLARQATAAAAAAAPAAVLPLPAGAQPEGVAVGTHDGELWVACLSGRILHVDLKTNTTTTVHIEHGVALSGAKFCPKQQALFAAGSLSGKAYIFHMQQQQDGSYRVARKEVVQLCAAAGLCYVNDCVMTDDRVFFTDSFHPHLSSIPRFSEAGPRPVQRIHTGPHFATKPGQFRANGLTLLASNATTHTLLISNTHTGALYRVAVQRTPQPAAPLAAVSGGGLLAAVVAALQGAAAAAAAADVTELPLPAVKGKVADKLLLDGLWAVNSSFVWAADNMNNRVWGVAVSASGGAKLSCLIENSGVFATPTTLAVSQGLLWAVNAHLDTCFPFLPCPSHAFELVGVQPQRACVPWHGGER